MNIKAPLALILALFLALAALTPALASQEGIDQPDQEALATFFDDTLFVGDSLMRQLQRHAVAHKNNGAMALGAAKFATAQGYMLFTATLRSNSKTHRNLQYRGLESTMFSLVQHLKPQRLIVLAGINDGVPRDFANLLIYAERTIDLARRAQPGVQIAMMSLCPMTLLQDEPLLKQENIDAFNLALAELCQLKGVDYIDVASQLKGADGFLPLELSSDNRLHLSEQGLEIMLDCVYAYAKSQMEGDQP